MKGFFPLFVLSLIMCFALYGQDILEDKSVIPEQLYDLIEKSDHLVVKESPLQNAKTLFESKDRKDLVDLKGSLVIKKPEQWFHCMCFGTPAIYFYKEGKELGWVTNHHGIAVRSSLWSSDAPVIDIEKWLTWFDERKIADPRKEVEAMKIKEEKHRKDWERWMNAMPKAIKPLWANAIFDQIGRVNIAPLLKEFETAVPNKSQRIFELLEWFGSGAGPWSGFPAYESAAEEMLLEYITIDLVAAIQSIELTPNQIEGAARLFGGWTFSKKRPNALKDVPDSIKELLWNHVKSSSDKDKLDRAKYAFRS